MPEAYEKPVMQIEEIDTDIILASSSNSSADGSCDIGGKPGPG